MGLVTLDSYDLWYDKLNSFLDFEYGLIPRLIIKKELIHCIWNNRISTNQFIFNI